MQRLFLVLFFLFPILSFAASPNLAVFPDVVIQGEPVRITVENVSGAAVVRKITFDGKAVAVLSYQGKPSAFIGIDLNKKPADYKLIVTLADGTKLEKIITVTKREKIEAVLDIPEKLGGNTPKAAKVLVSSLSSENREIYSVRSILKQLWKGGFRFPVNNPIVTDNYGYVRQTVGYSITHKGADFKAKEGTPVFAMNIGIVRFAKNMSIYGNTIIIDHGFNLYTVYMHLSKIKVNEGEFVKGRQLIGLSGSTGYAESPHLHISVWIDKVSIDPMKFMALFK